MAYLNVSNLCKSFGEGFADAGIDDSGADKLYEGAVGLRILMRITLISAKKRYTSFFKITV